MRKNIFIALAALMTLAVSCKKNNIEKTDNAGTDPNPAVVLEQSPDITRIIKFNNDVKLRRENPDLKTREVITLDEAKDNIADLFNAVYGEPTEYYGETEHAEFSVTLPVDADGNVLLDDAAAAYEEAVELARESYHASTLENKGYICMSATVEQQRGGTAEVKLNGVFGKKTEAPTQISTYFDPGQTWPYRAGEINGYCIPTQFDGADMLLEIAMDSLLNIKIPNAPDGYRTIIYRGIAQSFSGANYKRNLFYRERDNSYYTCISGDSLNYFLDSSINIVTAIIPESLGIPLMRGGDPYINIPKIYKIVALTVEGKDYEQTNNNPRYITHSYKVTYGAFDYIENTQIQQNEL